MQYKSNAHFFMKLDKSKMKVTQKKYLVKFIWNCLMTKIEQYCVCVYLIHWYTQVPVKGCGQLAGEFIDILCMYKNNESTKISTLKKKLPFIKISLFLATKNYIFFQMMNDNLNSKPKFKTCQKVSSINVKLLCK